MPKGRLIQDIPMILWKEIRSNCKILLEEFQIIFVGSDTRKNSVMWKVTLKWLPKTLGPLDFFAGNCKKILPWVAPYAKSQLKKSSAISPQRKAYMDPYPAQAWHVVHTKTCSQQWGQRSRFRNLRPHPVCQADIVDLGIHEEDRS